jgi:hypothetical protein
MSTSVMICAGARGGGTDFSEGDSGGPIFDREGTLAGWSGGELGLRARPGEPSRRLLAM